MPLLARIGPLARTFDFVADAAPGVKEILTVGKLCYEVREHHYDLVVVDAVATGHIVGQLAAPRAINDLVQVGLVRDQTRWMIDILDDPARTGVVIVTTPEEMPVDETIELARALGRRRCRSRCRGVVVNRVLPELFGRVEEEALRPPAHSGGRRRPGHARAAHGGHRRGVLDAAALAVALRRQRAEHLAMLQSVCRPVSAVLFVPELFARSAGDAGGDAGRRGALPRSSS